MRYAKQELPHQNQIKPKLKERGRKVRAHILVVNKKVHEMERKQHFFTFLR